MKKTDLVKIRGGLFTMSKYENQDFVSLRPRKVKLNNFWISKYCVTHNDYYDYLIKENIKSEYHQKKVKSNIPVTFVSWYDAIRYCNFLSKEHGFEPCYKIQEDPVVIEQKGFEKNGYKFLVEFNKKANGFRLPSAAEWEYAARNAGQDDVFISNELNGDILESINAANIQPFSNIEETFSNIKEKGKVSEVDSYLPNALGLSNMSGNVSEWCFDYFQKAADINPDPTYYNPFGPETNEQNERVTKGGSYRDHYVHCGVIFQKPFHARTLTAFIGFRVAKNA